MAGVLMSVTLVPALRLLRNSLRIGREIETYELLTTFSTSRLEEYLALTSADWQPGTFTGDFSADGHANLRYSVVCSDAAGDGGMADQLMAIVSTVWEDANSNATRDSGELTVVLASKTAKTATYQAAARGGP